MRESFHWFRIVAASLVVLSLFSIGSVEAQIARLLLQENRPLPGVFPPLTPTNLGNSSIHSNGTGFVVKSGSGLGDFFWGSPSEITANGQILGLVGTATSNSTTSSLPMAALAPDGRVLFTTAGAPYRLWEIPASSPSSPANVIAQAGTNLPTPLASALGASTGDFYGNFLSTFSYSDGLPVWRATWNNVPPSGGTTFPPNWSLIKGDPMGTGPDAPLVLVAPGQTFANVPNPVASTTSIRAFGFTSVGVARESNNHIVEVFMERTGGITSNNDSVMILNGQGLVLGGTLVQERNIIPTSIGGLPGEEYRSFKAAHISATGDYGFRVQSFSPGASLSELLFINGEVALREGDSVSYLGNDFVLDGGNFDYELLFNSQGDWVTNWNTTSNNDVIIVNGQVVAASNFTPVDSTGDGLGDTTFGFTSLVIDRLAITDRRADGTFDVLFQASTIIDGAIVQGVYAITVPEPSALGLLMLSFGCLLRRKR